MSIPTQEPTRFVAGETLKWRRSFPDYPTSEGWTLTYQFRSTVGGFDASSAVVNGEFEVTVATATTENLAGGTYSWRAWVEKAGEKHLVGSGEMTVEAPFSEANSEWDGRSQVKKILDAIDAMIANKATLDQKSYVIGNRQLERYPIPDLLLLREKYARLYATEQRQEAMKNGAGPFKTIFTRFTRPQ